MINKNRSFPQRLGYACKGLAHAWRTERSFRTQLGAVLFAITVLAYFRASPEWWALFTLACGGVLSAELMNTALEQLIDHLHPDLHPAVGRAKDVAAASVLVFSVVALTVFSAFLMSRFWT